MVPYDKVKHYLTTVCEQVRWKKAHLVLSQELENHLVDQIDALMDQGLEEEDAIDQAILEMGDPVIVGTQLDYTHRPKMEWSILSFMAFILAMGVLSRAFLPQVGIPDEHGILTILIGCICMSLAYSLDFTVVGRYPYYILSLLLFLSALYIHTYTPTMGRNLPWEYLLLFFSVVFSGIIYKMRNKSYYGIIMCVACLLILLSIGLSSGELSALILYTITAFMLLIYAICKRWFRVKRSIALTIVFIGVFIPWISIFFINPYGGMNVVLTGYSNDIIQNTIQKARFIGQSVSGCVDGTGVIHTNYAITYLIDQFGFISLFFIILILLAFIIRMLILSSKQKSILGVLVSKAIIITFVIQAVAYIHTNLGGIIFATTPLLCIAYGGWGMVINMALIGLLLSVFKSGDVVRDENYNKMNDRNRRIEVTDGGSHT